jgi:hypothetical protein
MASISQQMTNPEQVKNTALWPSTFKNATAEKAALSKGGNQFLILPGKIL